VAALSLFDRLNKQISRLGIQRNTKESLKWFESKIGSTGTSYATLTKELKDAARIQPGRMYTFVYDPKGKETLPYYDKYPLILLVETTSDGFYGLNMHYLPTVLRAKLLDRLLEYTSDEKIAANTKISMSYGLLKGAAKLKLFAPCFKRYLRSHVRSNVSMIPATEWEIAVFLPTQKFVGATKETVWNESRRASR
jgi:cysteine synthase